MSANNAIIVLKSPGPEFRVAHVLAADRLESPCGHNLSRIADRFASSPVFTEESAAWKAAFAMEEEIGFVQHGVYSVHLSAPLFGRNTKKSKESGKHHRNQRIRERNKEAMRAWKLLMKLVAHDHIVQIYPYMGRPCVQIDAGMQGEAKVVSDTFAKALEAVARGF